eukprot:scaffold405250_cov28-Attheya_sp.AAC.1
MPVSGLFFFFRGDARYGPQPRRFGTGTYLFLFVERIVEFSWFSCRGVPTPSARVSVILENSYGTCRTEVILYALFVLRGHPSAGGLSATFSALRDNFFNIGTS